MTEQYNGPGNTVLDSQQYYNLTPAQRHQAAEEGLARLSDQQREALQHYEESSFFAQLARGEEWHQQPGNRAVYRENFINSQVLDQAALDRMVDSYAQVQEQQAQRGGHGLNNFPLQIEVPDRMLR